MENPTRLVSWNVNGLRAALKKGLIDFINKDKSDVYCFQEIKTKDIPLELQGLEYNVYPNPAVREGYSGTLTLSKVEPFSVLNGLGVKEFDDEGRVQVLEFADFLLINSYFPNSQHGLTRLDYKLRFDEEFLTFAEKMRKLKPLVICGDFNVAHEEIDIARPKDNVNNAGFTPQEREWMSKFLAHGYVDTFRYFVKDGGHYTWWSYRFNARQKNIGWRIDYFVISNELLPRLKAAGILEQVTGSDHAPVYIELKEG